jgi:hypothetical protein
VNGLLPQQEDGWDGKKEIETCNLRLSTSKMAMNERISTESNIEDD